MLAGRVREYSKVAAPAGARGARCGRGVIGIATLIVLRGTTAQARLADRFGQCRQIIVIRCAGRESAFVANHFPTLRCGDAGSVCFTQIPGMWFGHRCQWPDHRGRVGVHVGERRNSGILATWSAATTHGDHADESNALDVPMCSDTLRIRRFRASSPALGGVFVTRLRDR